MSYAYCDPHRAIIDTLDPDHYVCINRERAATLIHEAAATLESSNMDTLKTRDLRDVAKWLREAHRILTEEQ